MESEMFDDMSESVLYDMRNTPSEDLFLEEPGPEVNTENKSRPKTKTKELKKEQQKKKEEELKRIEKYVDNKLDIENLICEVEKHPCIWDSSLESYANKIEKLNAWRSVVTSVIEDFEELTQFERDEIGKIVMKKWKHVRGSYAREIVKRKSEQKSGSGSKPRKQYIYFEQLRFLDPVTKKTSDSINSNDNASETELETTECLEDEIRTAEKNDKQKKTKRTNKQQDDEVIEILKKRVISDEVQDKSEETDGDKLFLLSLLPELKFIPQERKLKVRSDILSVIANAQAPTAPYIPPTNWPPQQSNPNQPPFGFPTINFQSHSPVHILTTHPTSHPHPTVNASFNQQHQFPTFNPQNMNNPTQPQQSNSRPSSTFSSCTDSVLNSPYDSSIPVMPLIWGNCIKTKL